MDTNKQILKLLDSRIFFLSGKFFELIEKNFPDAVSSDKWRNVRDSVLNLTNDVVRANHEDMQDCDVKYSPVRVIEDGGKVKYRFSADAMKVFKHAVFNINDASLALFSKHFHVLDGIRSCLSLDDAVIKKTQSGLFVLKLTSMQCKNNMHILKEASFSKENYPIFKQWCHIIESIKCEDCINARR